MMETAPTQPTEQWHRLHRATPLIRAWSTFLALIVISGFWAFDFEDPGSLLAAARDHLWMVAAAIALILVVMLACMYLAWRMMSYSVDDEAAHMRKGVLFRTKRSAQLDRIQAIDIRKPLLARLAGLAELTIEVAGGAGSQVQIGFLRDEVAVALRAEILAKAAGLKAGAAQPSQVSATDLAAESGAQPQSDAAGLAAASSGATSAGALTAFEEAPEVEVTVVPAGRLLGSALLSFGVLLGALFLVALVVAAIVLGPQVIGIGLIPVVIGVGSLLWSRFAGEFNFRVAISPDGIRIRRGLTETRAQTIPPGRIQAVQIAQGLLWRRQDWWRVRMTVAGYSAETADATHQHSVLLPVGTRAEAMAALSLVLPDFGAADPVSVINAGLTGKSVKRTGEATDPYFTPNPRRSRFIDWFAWRRNGFAVTDRALLLRGGRMYRYLQVVPHERTQSLCLQQGPLARRLGLAAFKTHVPVGMVIPQMSNLDAQTAAVLLDEQSARARQARAAVGPEKWMSQVVAARS